MEVKRVLTIAGSDSGGGAGIQADLKTITVLGGFGMSVVTALTAQNTLGVQGILEVPVDFVEKQFDSVLSDIGADAAKTGMIPNHDVLGAVCRKIKEYRIEKLVVDPVMVAKGGQSLVTNEVREEMINELIPISLVVTPNIPEAEVLSGIAVNSVDDMKEAARIIHERGARNVVLKGGHLEGRPTDVLYDGRTFHHFRSERFDTDNTHGTGCTFSAAIATGLALGMSVYDSVSMAKEYIASAIKLSLRIGRGRGPTNHFPMEYITKRVCGSSD
jgi:hydroxymethylpyrimidine/phosphomethylpyrimidine kinase